MNKQELIDELAKYVKRYENVMDDYSQGRYGAYKVSLKLMKRLNEPNITDEQAWNKISEAYPESAQCLRNTLDNAVFGNASEPQKPIVPQFVADWFEKLRKQIVPYHFESGARFMMFIGRDFHHKKGLTLINEEIRQWLEKDGNEVILSNAIDFGYEVEKEPLYRVKIGEGYFVEYQGRGALIMPDCNKEIKIFDSKSDAERTAQTIGGTVEEVAE
ncbi:DUF1642 domain-containing protein [Enterococcus hirae]|nr:DUF1642 domain-containing protein [Enterococcus hirae]